LPKLGERPQSKEEPGRRHSWTGVKNQEVKRKRDGSGDGEKEHAGTSSKRKKKTSTGGGVVSPEKVGEWAVEDVRCGEE